MCLSEDQGWAARDACRCSSSWAAQVDSHPVRPPSPRGCSSKDTPLASWVGKQTYGGYTCYFILISTPKREMHSSFSAGKWHLGVNCERRGDHCHHPNQHGFSYFYGLPFTLFNDCVPGEGTDILADLQQTLRSLTIFLGSGLLTLVRLRVVGPASYSQVFVVKNTQEILYYLKLRMSLF